MPDRSARSATRRGRSATIVDAATSRLWPLPLAGVILSVALGVALVRFDAWASAQRDVLPDVLLFDGDAGAARDVLSAVVGSMITVTSLTFSLTIVTLQLASSQFSPRLLRMFAADRFVQATLTVFLATFSFAVTVLPNVRGDGGQGDGLVPRASVSLAVVLTLASVVALVLFLAHLAREIRVETMLAGVHADTRATIERELPPTCETTSVEPPSAGEHSLRIPAPRSGFLVAVDQKRLLATAQRTGAVLWLAAPLGSSVVQGVPIAFARPITSTSLDLDDLTESIKPCLTIDFERSGGADISFGLRQITDIAAKALSPGINDPTTAIHALGHSAAVLTLLADRPLDPVLLRDDDETVRAVLAPHSFADLLDLAVEQPRRYGSSEPAVHGRLLQLLQEVAWMSQHRDRREAVSAQLDRTMAVIAEQSFDRALRRRLDAQAEAVRAAVRGEWAPPSG